MYLYIYIYMYICIHSSIRSRCSTALPLHHPAESPLPSFSRDVSGPLRHAQPQAVGDTQNIPTNIFPAKIC